MKSSFLRIIFQLHQKIENVHRPIVNITIILA